MDCVPFRNILCSLFTIHYYIWLPGHFPTFLQQSLFLASFNPIRNPGIGRPWITFFDTIMALSTTKYLSRTEKISSCLLHKVMQIGLEINLTAAIGLGMYCISNLFLLFGRPDFKLLQLHIRLRLNYRRSKHATVMFITFVTFYPILGFYRKIRQLSIKTTWEKLSGQNKCKDSGKASTLIYNIPLCPWFGKRRSFKYCVYHLWKTEQTR